MIYLKSCPSLKSKIESTGYTKNQLITLFDKYYKCSHSKPSTAVKPTKTKYRFGFFAGPQFNDLRFTAYNDYPILHANFSKNPGFTFGAILDIVLPVNNNNYIIHNELGYSSYKSTGKYSSFLDSTDYTYINYKFGTGQLFLNSIFRYKFTPTLSSFFINGGFSLNYLLNVTNNARYRIRKFNQPNETITEGKTIEQLKSFELGFILGIGYQYKQFSGEIRYKILPDISRNSAYHLPVRTFSIELAYQLK